MIQPQSVRDRIAAVLAPANPEVDVVNVAVEYLFGRRRAHDGTAYAQLRQVDAE